MSVQNEINIISQQAFLSQREFADALSVFFPTVNRWETGKTIPKISTMRKIKEFCDSNDIPIDGLQMALMDYEGLTE